MSAAVRQGRDSWCQSARSPPFRGWHDICSSTVTGLEGLEALRRALAAWNDGRGAMAMSAMFGKTALVRDRVDARADRTTAYCVDIGPTDGVRILVAGHPGQGGHPRVITATMATNASFRDVIVR
eukprot:CAMPEP_0182552872 /NCGR_PEP_ID=MMETSP1323-20130603/49198_1 /TAXON_ID=236787 /ORGANISM="Florenciella parvula, Strain RCC1693" /LENGTH=124 /DNA_ID=CAMNT_0024764585 /DNA_START=600 /DNA_END=971 /DNA_ORIENTATION=-